MAKNTTQKTATVFSFEFRINKTVETVKIDVESEDENLALDLAVKKAKEQYSNVEYTGTFYKSIKEGLE